MMDYVDNGFSAYAYKHVYTPYNDKSERDDTGKIMTVKYQAILIFVRKHYHDMFKMLTLAWN